MRLSQGETISQLSIDWSIDGWCWSIVLIDSVDNIDWCRSRSSWTSCTTYARNCWWLKEHTRRTSTSSTLWVINHDTVLSRLMSLISAEKWWVKQVTRWSTCNELCLYYCVSRMSEPVAAQIYQTVIAVELMCDQVAFLMPAHSLLWKQIFSLFIQHFNFLLSSAVLLYYYCKSTKRWLLRHLLPVMA